MQSQLSESQLNSSVSVERTDGHQRESARVNRTGKSDQKSMATVLQRWVHDDQKPRMEDSRRFSMEVEQKVERRILSQFPEIARLLLVNRSLSRKERWSRLEASGKQSWQHYRRNGSYSGRRGGHPSIQASEEEGFHVQVHECMMGGTLAAKLFKFLLSQFLSTFYYSILFGQVDQAL